MEESILNSFPSVTIHYGKTGEQIYIVSTTVTESVHASVVFNVLFGAVVEEATQMVADHDPTCDCEFYKLCKNIIALQNLHA